ncbi:MAG TPA: membrane protein insertase YidC [Gemmataceae bacterium]|nr:membrane protein insertase YidC [Gemmataceae bacterium]
MQKNYVLLALIIVIIFVGWYWVQNQIWPPRRADQQQQAKTDAAKKDGDKKKEGEPKADEKKDAKQPEVKQPDQKPEVKEKPEVKAKPEEKVPPKPPPETYTLGGPDTHLQVVLTTRGAGVQKLTLNRFKAADYLGKPVDHELELIPDDEFIPSYLMYHYPDPTDTDKPPVLSLGLKTWKFEARAKNGDVEEIKFSARVPGQEHIKIVKTYRLGPKDYHLGLLVEIERDKKGGDAKAEKFRYQIAGAHGLPIEAEPYTSTFRKAIIGLLDDRNSLWRELDNEDSFRISHRLGGDKVPAFNRGGGMVAYAGVANQYFAAVIVPDNVQPQADAGGVDRKGIIAWARPTLETTEQSGRLRGKVVDHRIDFEETRSGKQGGVLKLLGSCYLLPHVERHLKEANLKDGDQVMLSTYVADGKRVATWIRRGQSPRAFLDDITVRVNSEPIDLRPGEKVAHQFLLYHGPVKTRLLGQFSGDAAVREKLVDRYTDTLHLRTLTDYGSIGFFRTIGWSRLLIWTTSLMHGLLYLLSFLVFGSNGLSIILLTVLVRGLMFPISKKQALFSIKMQEMQPELKKIQEKYKNDPQSRTQVTMELHRKHNVNMFGGCLPMLLQLPIFLGLYYALQESISFRLASFLWIDNLAAPDMLAWWGESIPYVSDPDSQGGFFYLGPFFNLLPIFAVALMFFQQKMMMPPPTDEQQALNQKVMQFTMVFMGIVFYKVASGLCLYFIASSLWGVAERKLLPKKKKGEPPTATSAQPNGKPASPRGKGRPPAKPEGNGAVQKVKDWWAELLKEARKK